MTGRRPGGVSPGLCARCVHARVVETRTGSRFWLCGRSRTDEAFPRYPRLPVLSCGGFEEESAHSVEAGPDPQRGEAGA